MKIKTCDRCQHYEPPENSRYFKYFGSCNLTGDWSDFRDGALPEADHAYGWDYEGYSAGVYVGPKFGCIHWVRRQPGETK